MEEETIAVCDNNLVAKLKGLGGRKAQLIPFQMFDSK